MRTSLKLTDTTKGCLMGALVGAIPIGSVQNQLKPATEPAVREWLATLARDLPHDD